MIIKMNIIIKPDQKNNNNNKTKNELLITQRNQGREGSRGQNWSFLPHCGPRNRPCAWVILSWCHSGGNTITENLQDHLQELLCLRVNRAPVGLINSMVSWDARFRPPLPEAPLYVEPTFLRWTGGGRLKGGAAKGTGGHRSTRNGPWSKKNNLSPCLWTATLNPDSSEKQNCSFRSWVFVERVQGRAEEAELFRVPPRGTPTLPGDPCSARGEPLDPESGTKAVAPPCSLPWANWKWPLGSYRFLSVWGTSSRGRTHRSRGVQFISGRPGRQILHEKQMLLTMPHPRAMTALWSAKYFPPHPHPGEKEKGRNRNTDAEKTCVDVVGGGGHIGWPRRLGLT